jgi:hypothetical protein
MAEIARSVGSQFCPTVFRALEAEYEDPSSSLHPVDRATASDRTPADIAKHHGVTV